MVFRLVFSWSAAAAAAVSGESWERIGLVYVVLSAAGGSRLSFAMYDVSQQST